MVYLNYSHYLKRKSTIHPSSQKAILNQLEAMPGKLRMATSVKVKISDSKKVIDITYDNRKYIGRLQLVLQGDKYLVYFMDKENGKITSTDAHSSKSAYLEINDVKQAKEFVRWYGLLLGLVTMKRTRAVKPK